MATLNGTTGNDTLFSNGLYSQINGLAGNDTIHAEFGVGVDGGPGTDTLWLDLQASWLGLTVDFRPLLAGGSIAINGAVITGIEALGEIHGTLFDDTIHLGDTGATLNGQLGQDTLTGGNGADTIYGGDDSDTVIGGDGNDRLWGGNDPSWPIDGTPDTILGGNGNDEIHAGYGDTVDGGAGTDKLWLDLSWSPAGVNLNLPALLAGGTLQIGGAAISGIETVGTIVGTPFNDTISMGNLGGTADGGDGVDKLIGGTGDDTIHGGYAPDTIIGGDGNDTLFGDDDGSADTIDGGAGNDTIHAGIGDNVAGGSGFDTLTLALHLPAGDPSGAYVDLGAWTSGSTFTVAGATISGIEAFTSLSGTELADTLIAPGAGLTILGMGGDDTLIGGKGADVLDGGDANDTLYSDGLVDTGAVHDTLIGGAGVNIFHAGFGDTVVGHGLDTLYLSLAGAPTGVIADFSKIVRGDYVVNAAGTFDGINVIGRIDGSAFDDTITLGRTLWGPPGHPTGGVVDGGAGNDVLIGGDGIDTLLGGAGDDRITAGIGDKCDGGTGFDTLTLSLAGAASGVTASFAGIETVGGITNAAGHFAGFEAIALLTGSSYADRITLGAKGGTVRGGDGADILTGGAGANVLSGGAGDDTIWRGSGTNTLSGDAGNDVIHAGFGDQVQGGPGVDTLYLSLANAKAGVTADFTAVPTSVNVTLSTGQYYGIDILASVTGSAFDDNLILGNRGGELLGGNGNDILTGGYGSDRVSGGYGNDVLSGGGGNDVLAGERGADTLIGGAGADAFRFSAPPFNAEADTVKDFVHHTDHIEIARSSFAAFASAALGALPGSAFVAGTAAVTADQHLIYDRGSGTLWYDADGSGAGAKVMVATFTGQPLLDASDILLV